MIYERKDFLIGLEKLQQRFGGWKPEELSLVSVGENHLVEGKNFLSWLRTTDPVENIILDLLEQYALKSESVGVNSGVDVVKNILTKKSVKSYGQICDEMSKSRYPRVGDFERIVRERFEEKYHELLLNILKVSETDGNLFLKRENVVKVILEKLDGYIFYLDSPMKVHFDERNVKCFIIDGFVESVGEIHHILEHMSKSNIPGIIFARNFANDVITTLQHNRILGRMNVLPIQVSFDIEDLNTLVDLAIISSGDVVSSDKGDLIRTISTESIPTLERVIFKNGRLMIVNSKTVSKVRLHLKNLRERAAKTTDEVRRKMLESRMGSLSTNCLKISIPLGKQYDKLESIVDSFLRLIRSCLFYGVLEVDGNLIPVTTYISSNAFTKRFLKVIDGIQTGIIPD